MQWLIDQDWHYHVHPLETPAETFDGYGDFIEMWRSKGGCALPPWSAFDIMDFEGWWGWVSVYDIVDLAVPSFRVRLYGSELAALTGMDPSGKVLTPSDAGIQVDATNITLNDFAFLAHIASNGLIGHMYGPHKVELGHSRILHELYLPLSSDGTTVDKMMFVGRSVKQASSNAA